MAPQVPYTTQTGRMIRLAVLPYRQAPQAYGGRIDPGPCCARGPITTKGIGGIRHQAEQLGFAGLQAPQRRSPSFPSSGSAKAELIGRERAMTPQTPFVRFSQNERTFKMRDAQLVASEKTLAERS